MMTLNKLSKIIEKKLGTEVSWKVNCGKKLCTQDVVWDGSFDEDNLKGFRMTNLNSGDVFTGQTYKTNDGVNFVIDYTIKVTITDENFFVEFDKE